MVCDRIRPPVPRPERQVDTCTPVAHERLYVAKMVVGGEVIGRRGDDQKSRFARQGDERLGRLVVPVQVVAPQGLSVVVQHVEVKYLSVSQLHHGVPNREHLTKRRKCRFAERLG